MVGRSVELASIQALGLVEAFTSTVSGNTAGRGGGLAATQRRVLPQRRHGGRRHRSPRSGGGAFTSGQQRSDQVGGSGSGFAAQGGTAGGCGIPDGAEAVEASVTAVTPSGSGFLRAWPAHETAPNATFLNFTVSRSTTNTGSISLAPTGTQDLAIKNYAARTHYVIDLQGYWVR